MEDRYLVENLLNMTKAMVELYQHAAIESPTDNIHQEFSTLLSDTLCMQHEIYTAMSEMGWYKTEKAEKKQITKTVSKYASSN
ncbi:MAG: spore coat protein [Erysipelotrichales bacterium]|nr:spore coat protein [Erysipelotrichales bacterium]